jgi:ATP-dependent DNA ligase
MVTGRWLSANGQVHLRLRNNRDFNARYSAVAKALAPLSDETLIDGEVVALDTSSGLAWISLYHGDLRT